MSVVMGWTFKDLSVHPAFALAQGTPAAYNFAAQRTWHVVHRAWSPAGDLNETLYEWYGTADGDWGITTLTDVEGSPPVRRDPTAYVFAGEGTQHVLYTAAFEDDHVHEFWWDDGDWHHSDLTDSQGAGVTDHPAQGYSLEASTDSSQHIIYRGLDGSINELARAHHGWNHYNLTTEYGAPGAAAKSPFGYPFNAQGSQHIIYLGFDGSIHELRWNGSHWMPILVATPPESATPRTGPVGYAFTATGTQHVFYADAAGHIYELKTDGSGSWLPPDDLSRTGAPASSSFQLAAYPFDPAPGVPVPTQHVFYRDSSSHINELWRDVGDWQHNDFSDLPGLPLAAGDPSGFADSADGSQHVFYVSLDHHLIALTWTPQDVRHLTGAVREERTALA
jgi:hypothetical protein